MRGDGEAVLLIHETAASAAVWDPLASALDRLTARVIAYDRRGWGGSGAPEPYLRTTIEEHAEDAFGLLESLDAGPALLCGAGLGAVAALDLILRRPALSSAAILIEPPLLAFLPDATEGLSADRKAIEEAVREGGPEAALARYLAGAFGHLGPGAERIPDPAQGNRPLSLFAELGAVPGWQIRRAELATVSVPSRIVVADSTPPVLVRAAEQLAGRLGGSELIRVGGAGLPQVSAAPELAATIGSLLG